MADACGLDMDEIVLEKIKKNEEKYPVEKAYGSKEKYPELKGKWWKNESWKVSEMYKLALTSWLVWGGFVLWRQSP